jgi:hypothetical protein
MCLDVFGVCIRAFLPAPTATHMAPLDDREKSKLQFMSRGMAWKDRKASRSPNSINSGPGSKNSPILFESKILAIAMKGSLRRNNFGEVVRWVLSLLMQIRNSQDFG